MIQKILYIYLFIFGFTISAFAQDTTRVNAPVQPQPAHPTVPVPYLYAPPKSPNKLPNKNQLATLADAASAAPLKQATVEDLALRSNEKGNVFAIGVVGSDNPFALGISYENAQNGESQNISIVEPEVRKPLIEFPEEEVIETGPSSGGWLFYVLFAILGYFVVLVSVYRAEIIKMIGAFANINMAQQAYRDQKMFLSPTDIFTYILFFMSAGSFIFLFLRFLGAELPFRPLIDLFACMFAVAAIYLLKHLQLFILSLIFPFRGEVSLYSFIISNSNKVLGIVLVPLVFLSAYVPTMLQSSFLWFTLGVLGLAYLYRSFRGLIISGNYLLYNKFHFLLYLCAVEIAPVFLLVKIILKGA